MHRLHFRLVLLVLPIALLVGASIALSVSAHAYLPTVAFGTSGQAQPEHVLQQGTPTTTSTKTRTPTPTRSPTRTNTPTITSTATQTPIPTPIPSCWEIVPSPSIESQDSFLFRVDAISPTDVWAVGSYRNSDGLTRNLIEHWDGVEWTIVSSPNIGPYDNVLLDVTAITSNDVWAVGYYFTAPHENQGLILHWDGVEWSVVPGSERGDASILKGVTAVTAHDIWAVGQYSDQGRLDLTSILHWDGVNWNIVSSPNLGISNNLYGITAISWDDIWAVGQYYHYDLGQPLALHWDGSAWNSVPVPNDQFRDNLFRAVVSIAHDDVWAVGGTSSKTSSEQQTLVGHWDGVRWTIISSPSPGALVTYLVGVSAVSENSVWAVGSYIHGYGYAPQTLLLHWDGIQWSEVSSPNAGVVNNQLYGVDTLPSGEAWAVGLFQSTDFEETLVMRNNLVQFMDVPVDSPFYSPIRCLACRAIVSGYECGSPGEPCPGVYFRPGADVTRGQLSKIVTNAAAFTDPIPPDQQTFEDVPPDSPFWLWIERLSGRGAISGYSCGSEGEPCLPPNDRPYFRPGNNATRGQIAKIVSNAADIQDPIPSIQQTFEDVPNANPFWLWIERLSGRGVIGGYPCGAVGEPCVPPDNRPYFRPENNTTRGQMSKIAANAVIPGCQTPSSYSP